MTTAPGPFGNEQEAVAAAHALVPPAEGRSILSVIQRRQLVEQALAEAGVELSPYEVRMVGWLTGWEDATVSVIVRWITKAHEATP